MSDNLYEFRSISYVVPALKPGSNEACIIYAASFNIQEGILTLISGPSGAGKSTLLRFFNRLSDPTSGEIIFDGKAIREYPVMELRRRIGWVPQVPVRFPGTVDDNLRIPFKYSNSRNFSGDEIDSAINELKELALIPPELFKRDADDLSVGEAQRLNLLRSLALSPEVLLLDEPTSALDPEASETLLNCIKKIQDARKLTTIMVTHRPEEERLGQAVLKVKNGSVLPPEPLTGEVNG